MIIRRKCYYNIRFILKEMIELGSKLEKETERSLERLKHFINYGQVHECIPAMYYSATLLQRYSKQKGESEQTNHQLFINFKEQFQEFTDKNRSLIKQSHKHVIKLTQQIIDSEDYVKNLPNQFRNSIQRENGIENNPSNGLNLHPATKKYNFQTSKNIHETLKNYSPLKQNIISQNIHAEPQEPSEQQTQINWKDIVLSYQEHRIDQAYSKSQQFSKRNRKTLQLQQQQFIQTIQLEYNTMIQFYSEFDKDGWIMDKEENGRTLEYKMYQEEKQIAIRMQAEFQIPVENFLAIMSEVELMDNYVPFCYGSTLIKNLNRNSRVAVSKINLPLLTDRQTYFYCVGYDRMAVTKSVFLYSMTVNDKIDHHDRHGYKVPKESQYVRLDYKFFIIEYIPLGGKLAKLRIASNCDLKLNFLPNFILSITARRFAFKYFENIIDISKNFEGSPWQKKIKENPQFYLFFKRKVQQYLQKGLL